MHHQRIISTSCRMKCPRSRLQRTPQSFAQFTLSSSSCCCLSFSLLLFAVDVFQSKIISVDTCERWWQTQVLLWRFREVDMATLATTATGNCEKKISSLILDQTICWRFAHTREWFCHFCIWVSSPVNINNRLYQPREQLIYMHLQFKYQKKQRGGIISIANRNN